MVEELDNPAVLSKSATVRGRRRLSVMQRTMMEGMAFMSGDSVVVVDVPPPPTCPADVGDLGESKYHITLCHIICSYHMNVRYHVFDEMGVRVTTPHGRSR